MRLSGRIACVGVVLVALGGAAGARAQGEGQVRGRVKADDLNLGSPQGRATYDARVRSAADALCTGSGSGVRDLSTSSSEHACREQVILSGGRQADMIVARQAAEQARMAAESHAIPYRELRRRSHRSALRRRHALHAPHHASARRHSHRQL